MTWFIFAGDMLVMLFMVILVTWVFMVSSDSEIDESARIPLEDEDYGDLPSEDAGNIGQQEAGVPHG